MSKSKNTRKSPKRPKRRKQTAQVPGNRQPLNSQALINSALQFQQSGNLREAGRIYRQVLDAEPENPDAWHLLGMTLHAGNQLESAIECLKNALVLLPDHPDVLANLGVVYRTAGILDQSQAVLEKSLQLKPNSVQALSNLGTVYMECGNLAAAQIQFEKALSLDPSFEQASMNLGNLWQRLGRFQDAEAIYRSLLIGNSADPFLLNNLAETLRHQHQWSEAIEISRRAMEIAPDRVEMGITLGRSLAGAGLFEQAEQHFQQLIDEYPNLAQPYHYLGKLQFDRREMVRSEANLKRAVQLDPTDIYALSSLGFAYLEMGKYDVAEACFRTVVSIDPTNSQAHGCLLFFMSGKPELSQQELFQEHQRWGKVHDAVEPIASMWTDSATDGVRNRRLRIGYVSPDFCDHAVNRFFQPVLEAHRSDHVETFCYAEVAAPDETTQSLMEFADHWRFTQGLSDNQIAQQVATDQIDILVDLAGHTGKNRLRVFAFRPAPIQVTWLGYPNTTGLDAINYRLTCEIQNPSDEPTYHTEELFRMPRGSFCFARPGLLPEVSELPAIGNGFVTFGSLHRPVKISEAARDLWASVLLSCPSSRLVVFNTRFTEASASELVKSLVARGVAAGRVDVRNHIEAECYRSIYHEVDVALDVTPWAGGTTTLEALWMGVPVIAFYGDRRSARSTAAIVHNIGHPELIARSPEEYVEIAVRLSDDFEQLSHLRSRLRENVQSTIVDSVRFTEDLEEAYREMWNRLVDRVETER